MTELQVIYKPNSKSIPISNSEDSVNVLREVWNMDLFYLQELVYVLFMNNANQLITYRCLHIGTCDSVLIDIKLLIGLVGAVQSPKIIIAHNHPGGKVKPSLNDIKITERVINACKLVDCTVLDHIILTDTLFYSFKDSGLLLT